MMHGIDAMDEPGGNRNLSKNIKVQQIIIPLLRVFLLGFDILTEIMMYALLCPFIFLNFY